MKLSHKALILVAIPLVFQLVFVGVLGYLLFQAEHNARKIEGSRNLVLETENLQRMFYEAGASLAGYNVTKNPLFSAQFGEAKNKIRMQLGLLERMASREENKGFEASRVARLIEQEMKLLDRLHDQIDRDEMVNGPPYQRIQEVSMRLSNIFEGIIERERQLAKNAPAAEKQLRQFIEQWLYSGVAINFALAIGLAVYFNTNTSRRLKTLMQNTDRVVKQEELAPFVGGNDEIAELDKRFREMSEELAVARRKERAVVEHALDVICTLSEAGQFLTINKSCRTHWGYREDELAGKQVDKILHSKHENPDEEIHPLLNTIRSQGEALATEAKIKRKDGTTADTIWSVHWSREDKRFYCVVHDITVRKEAERIRQEVVAMVSHDIRAPLTSISIGIEMLESGAKGELPVPAIGQLDKMSLSTRRLMRLVNDFLDLEKLQSSELELRKKTVNLDVLITNAVQELESIAQNKGITIKLEDADIDLEADGERLSQVISNLLSNAIKYSPKGGEIRLECERTDSAVEVRIADDGPGIDPDEQSSIFERFKQSSGAIVKNSSGLGLAICKSLVELHGGTIGVRSLPGAGSTFWFRIPCSNEPTSVEDA